MFNNSSSPSNKTWCAWPRLTRGSKRWPMTQWKFLKRCTTHPLIRSWLLIPTTRSQAYRIGMTLQKLTATFHTRTNLRWRHSLRWPNPTFLSYMRASLSSSSTMEVKEMCKSNMLWPMEVSSLIARQSLKGSDLLMVLKVLALSCSQYWPSTSVAAGTKTLWTWELSAQ